MPSAQECAERLREQAYRTLLPQIRDLGQELQSFNSSLSSGVRQLEQKLEILSHTELPSTEAVLSEILGEVVRRKESDTNTLALFAQGVHKKKPRKRSSDFFWTAPKPMSLGWRYLQCGAIVLSDGLPKDFRMSKPKK